MIDKLLVLGPGHSVTAQADLIREKRVEYKILAFQRTYPHCKTLLDIEPDYWTASDPYGFIEGLQYIEKEKIKKQTTILLPSMFEKDEKNYRKYCGSTPLLRQPNGWQTLGMLLAEALKYRNIKTVPMTSTKFIRTLSTNKDLQNNIFGKDAYYRFMHDEVILGSIPFDSESVIGTKYHWGLENKLTSAVLPISYFLKAKEVYVMGFDLFGPRFYSSDARHPWNDETQIEDAARIPLDIVSIWREWQDVHGMKIYSASNEDETLLSKVLETKKI